MEAPGRPPNFTGGAELELEELSGVILLHLVVKQWLKSTVISIKVGVLVDILGMEVDRFPVFAGRYDSWVSS